MSKNLEAFAQKSGQIFLDPEYPSIGPSEGRRIKHNEIERFPALGQTRHHFHRIVGQKSVTVR